MKCALVVTACLFIVAALAGCAGSTADFPPLDGPAESLRPGYEVVYYPKLQPGVTLDSLQAKLNEIVKDSAGSAVLFISGDIPNYKYWLDLEHIDISSGRIVFHKGNVGFNSVNSELKMVENVQPSFLTARLFGYNLLNHPIVVERSKEYFPYVIALKGLMTFHFGRREDDVAAAQTVADALYFLQQEQKKEQAEQDEELARFQPVAAKYRALVIKPPVPEEQRKYIVQANAMAEQKQYAMAEEKYLKAIELDPTSYPGAYYNMALLSAQENDPVTAIFRMKQYLMLIPDAKDARSAQDKIYEWEGMIGK